MRILLAVHHFPPRFTGGAEWQALRTARTLARRGHDVRVICVESITDPSGGGLKAELDEYQGVIVERLSFDLSATPDPFVWGYDNSLVGEYIESRMIEFRPEVFNLIGGYLISGRPLLTARERNIPSVVTLTDFWFLCPRINMMRSDGKLSNAPADADVCRRCLAEESRRYRLPAAVAPKLMDKYWETRKSQAENVRQRQEFLISAISEANAIISPSHFLGSMYVKSGVPEDKIFYCRQGLPPEYFAPTTTQRKSPRQEVHVGYVGQIAELKGVHILVRAAHMVADERLRVHIYGNTKSFPDYVKRLKSMVSADPRIVLAGLVLPDELSRVYADLDALVVPSLWYENSPNVILEAQCNRLPVIASDLGGMAEMVRSEVDGLLFPAGDVVGLARQIERVLDEPRLLESLSQGAPRVKTLDQEIDELLELYGSIMSQKVPTLS
ncbi:MAG: glycosyltransferase family 4 protein [Anaerolineales bacterium]|jgi:glycosyltransferase involved in cell wall biosynthesis